MKGKYFIFWAVSALLLAFTGCGGSSGDSGGDTGDDPASQTFTSGETSLSATTSTSGDTKTTVVTDANGETIVTMVLTVNGVSLTFPGQAETADTTFSEPLSSMPTNYAANMLATYIAGQVSGITAACVIKDTPGCDWFPDTQCTLGCCADHDYCYDLNGCGASSWLVVGASLACINCNGIAEVCIARACANVDSTRTEDRCYDNRCHQFYDCGVADCYTCTSPCSDSPVACTSSSYTGCCGNGTCEVGETTTNCAADCTDGDGYNQCCVANSDCPAETGSSCAPTCCCCGYGEVCTQDGSHVCTGSAAMTVKDTDPGLFGLDVPERCLGKPKSECL